MENWKMSHRKVSHIGIKTLMSNLLTFLVAEYLGATGASTLFNQALESKTIMVGLNLETLLRKRCFF